jgi:hypothetical protein
MRRTVSHFGINKNLALISELVDLVTCPRPALKIEFVQGYAQNRNLTRNVDQFSLSNTV